MEVEYHVLGGEAAEQILKAAHETRADVIVMGTHGRRGVAHLLMGSMAEQVVRTAPCPVLTVNRLGAAETAKEPELAPEPAV